MLAELATTAAPDDWLRRFHAGERPVIEQLYVDYFRTIAAAISGIVDGPDRETVIHELFGSLLERQGTRESFRGGSIAAWLATAARNRAIDLVRRRRRERIAIGELGSSGDERIEADDVAATARRRLAEFRATLPAAWCTIFDACFVRQLS